MEKIIWSIIVPIVLSLITILVSKYFENKSKKEEEIRAIASKKDEEIREIKRKRYEEFIGSIESILSIRNDVSNEEYFKELNLVYAKASITFPDVVMRKIKEKTNGYFDANSKKGIYLEIRKDMIGETDLTEEEFCHFE
ncbi:MAG: hypothetical protein RRY99_03240 [Flavobacterium sp.]